MSGISHALSKHPHNPLFPVLIARFRSLLDLNQESPPSSFREVPTNLILIMLVASAPRILWLLTTTDYDVDAGRRIINMMTLLYHPIWPPGYFFLAKPLYILFGHPEWVLRLLSFLSGIGTVGLVYYLLKAISGREKYALLSALFIALLPAHVSLSAQSLSEAPFVFFLMASLLALIKGRYCWCAILLGMATMIRYESLPLVIFIPVYLLLLKKVRQGNYENEPFTVLQAIVFFAISAVFPLLNLTINKLIGGFFFWQFPVEKPDLIPNQFAAHSFMGALGMSTSIFFKGISNIPAPRVTPFGRMGLYHNSGNPEQLSILWFLMSGFLIFLALIGIWYGIQHRWRGFPILVIVLTVLVGFLVMALIVGAAVPKPLLTLPAQTILAIFASISLGSFTAQKRIKQLGYLLTGFLLVCFIILTLTSRFSGPAEPKVVGNILKTLIEPSDVTVRLLRSFGLTGPAEQTDYLIKLAEKFYVRIKPDLHASSPVYVVILDGDFSALDDYRNDRIQYYADLSYDQFRRVPFEANWNILDSNPAIIILAQDSLELREPGLAGRLQTRLKQMQYSVAFMGSAFQVWQSP